MRLDEQQAHHARRVLRLKVGEPVELFDGCGRVGRGVIQSVSNELIVQLTELHAVDPPQPALDLAVAIPKGPRADDMVNQLGQLGVARLIALHSERSVVDPRQMKLKRFAKLAVASARQSGRAFVMQIAEPASLEQVLTMDHDLRLAAMPGADEQSQVADRLRAAQRVLILVGPEGGWTDQEIELTRQAHCVDWSIGRHMLRIETAAVAACAIAGYLASR